MTIVRSPLNYTGGKYKLLPQILPLFPQNINRFYDFFCGGCNVGLNVDCDKVYFIDKDQTLINMYQSFQNLDKDSLIDLIYEIIDKYGL